MIGVIKNILYIGELDVTKGWRCKMEFLAFSDIHFDKNHNKSSVSLGGLTTWMECQEDIIDQIVDYAQVNKIQNIFFGGDLFEKKNYLPQDLYNFVWDIFSFQINLHQRIYFGFYLLVHNQ